MLICIRIMTLMSLCFIQLPIGLHLRMHTRRPLEIALGITWAMDVTDQLFVCYVRFIHLH
jgi:hypothetical protein